MLCICAVVCLVQTASLRVINDGLVRRAGRFLMDRENGERVQMRKELSLIVSYLSIEFGLPYFLLHVRCRAKHRLQ